MWSRFTGKSDSGSSAPNKDKEDESRRHRTSDSTRSKRDSNSDMRSVVSSTSTRKPSRRDPAPSGIASFATAFDDMPRTRGSDDLYDDPRDSRDGRYAYGRDERPSSYAESSVSTTRRDRSRSRERDEKDKKRSREKEPDKKVSGWKRPSTRSSRSGSLSTAGGYKGDIVESPKQPTRSFSGQIGSEGFSQFPGQAGAPLMSGALPSPHTPSHSAMSSHVQAQFPGQDPAQFASSALPGGNPFGAAADYYQDNGASVHQQPGVRPQPPSVIVGQDTPHLIAAAAQPNPVADTGSGAAADFYGGSTHVSSSKPSRPSSMPGAFFDDDVAPSKPPRPSSKPSKPAKPNKLGSASALAGGAALGYAMGHGSSNTHQSSNNYQSNNHSSSSNYQSSSYTNGNSSYATPMYNQGTNSSYTTTPGSSQIPTYSQAMEGMPPPKPPRPGKPEKQSSSSNAGLYAAGAAGLAAYGIHQHNSHSNSHDHSHTHTHTHDHLHNHSGPPPGAFPGENWNSGAHISSAAYANGGMAQRHQHTGPVSRFVDWWKDHEDVQKMEEYTEYIGVCKYCFDPRSSVMDAPRKHHYGRRRSSEYMRPSGGIEKQSRYGLKEKKSYSSFSSGDEKRRKTSSNAAGWVAAGLGGIGLAKAGKAVLGARRDDFDDTYSIKSGRDHRSRISGRSRSRSRDRKDYSYGRSEIRRRSRSRDRMSQMSVGVTKDKKDHKVVRRRSRSRSRSSSRDGKSGFGTALGVGLAGAALGAAVNKRRKSRSRSPKKSLVQRRRDSSDDERRRKSQQLRRKSSRSSASGASIIDISQNQSTQGGFLGGFFAAPPPKIKKKRSFTASRKKKTKGFFNFGGNSSSSSSDSEMAFGTGYVQRKKPSSLKRRNSSPKRRPSSPKRRNSDERLKATLAGLGATAAAIAAAKAARRNSGKHVSDVVAVKEHRHQRKSSDRLRPASGYGDDEWEDLPDDDTSDSSDNAGLVYGDYDWRKGKSQESLASNGSGTNKWGWRWGFGGQKKRRSSDNLYNNIANTSFIGPASAGAVGAITGAAIGSKIGRHDSESSSVHTSSLQTVYPVASSDPTRFEARRTSSVPTPQPLITSGPGAISLQQPQPVHQVPGAIYSTQAPSQSGYSAPVGPPVFSQISGQTPYQQQHQTQNIIIQAAQPAIHPPLYRRANSSPIQTSSWKKDAAMAGLAAAAGGAAIAAAKNSHDRRSSRTSSPSNVRFSLTQAQADKAERELRKEQDHRDEEDLRHLEQLKREEAARRDEEDRRRREQQLRDDDARRIEDDRRREQLHRDEDAHREEERRRYELSRQQEEARNYMETERQAKDEAERRRQQEEMRAREAREAEDMTRRERESRAEAQRAADREAEAARIQQERREAERRDQERLEAHRRQVEARERAEQERLEQERRDQEAREYSSRYGSDREQRKLEQQLTGGSASSVATVVRRKEKELEERERDVMQPDTRKSTVASAVAAGAAAAITSAAISSYKDKSKDKKAKDKAKEKSRDRESRRDSSSTVQNVLPSSAKTSESPATKTYESSSSRKQGPPSTSIVEPSKSSKVNTVTPSSVKTYAPSGLQQDFADDDIYDPTLFKKTPSARDVLQDWEERYNGPQMTQAEFFAPKELLQNNNLPKVSPIDPNEGAPNLTVYEAHDDSATSHAMTPPYPTAYSFVATRDGRPPQQQSWPVPELNLIVPTPPGSRAPSDRGGSAPPSPAVEPVRTIEPARNVKPARNNEPVKNAEPMRTVEPVPAAEPVRTARERPRLDDANKARSRVSWGENQFHHFEVATPDSYQEQFMSDSDLKRQNKQSAAEAVTVEQQSLKSGQTTTTYQPYRPEYAPNASGPPESAPSTQYVRDEKDSDWDNIVDASSRKSKKNEDKKARAAAAAFASGVAAMSAGDWDDRKRDAASVISNPFSDVHAAASTIAPSTVAASTIAPSTVSSIPSLSHIYGSQSYEPASDRDSRKASDRATSGPGFVEGEVSAKPIPMHVPGSFDDDVLDTPVEEGRESSNKRDRKGKKKSESTDNVVIAQDNSKRVASEATPTRQPAKESTPEPEATLSKKEKKKKSKSGKRASVDSWELSDPSPPTSPTIERDVRDVEPTSSYRSTQEPAIASNTRSEKTSNNVAAAAMAGGFAALLGTSMKQDQERINSDFEHARQSLQSADKHDSREPSSSSNGFRQLDNGERPPSGLAAGFDEDDLVDAKTPRRKKEKRHSSGRWSPTIGSPLRTETKYEDYMGAPSSYDQRSFVEAPKVPTTSAFTSAPEPFSSRNVTDSGYHAPDDVPRKETAERDSDEFFSAGSDERERARNQARESDRIEESLTQASSAYDDDDESTVVPIRSKPDDNLRSPESSRSKYQDEIDREDRQSQHREAVAEGRDQSRDRTYELDDGTDRKRRHRRRETDEANDDWDTRSTISEARSDANGERRRKHKRRESGRDGSPESVVRSRSSAASEPGDLDDDRKSSRRRSKRDDDDNASVISTSSRYDDDRSSKKKEEKRSSGLLGLFSRSRENLAESSSKSTKPQEEDEQEGKHRRRKHRSDRGSTYGGSDDDDTRSTISTSKSREEGEEDGKRRRRKHRSDRGSTYGGSDDDDMRSTISSSSRREKRSSRSERGEGDRRDDYDEKVHRSSYAR
jgi:serine/arginine repetitive matrix protein 2